MLPLTKIFSDNFNRDRFIYFLRYLWLIGLVIGLMLFVIGYEKQLNQIENRVLYLEQSNEILREQFGLLVGQLAVRTDEDEGILEIIKLPHPDEYLDSEDA